MYGIAANNARKRLEMARIETITKNRLKKQTAFFTLKINQNFHSKK